MKRDHWGPVLVAGALALIFTIFLAPRAPAQFMVDAHGYHELGQSILRGFSFSRPGLQWPVVDRTPGYPFLLCVIYLIFGVSPLAAALVQAVLHAVTTYFGMRIAQILFPDRRVARVAIWVIALYPFTAWATTRIYSETLATFFATVLLFVLVRSHRSFGFRASIVCGVLFAGLMITRPSWMFVPVFAAVPLLWFRHLTLKHVALWMGTGFLLVSPWMIRTSLLTGRPALLAGGNGFSTQFFLASMEYRDLGAAYKKFVVDPDAPASGAHISVADMRRRFREPEKGAQEPRRSPRWFAKMESLRMKAGLTEVRAHPLAYVRSSFIRSVKLWIGVWHNGWPRIWVLLSRALSIALFGLALLGCVRGPWNAAWLLVLSFPLYLTLTHAFIHAEGRFSFPVRICLLMFAVRGGQLIVDSRVCSRWAQKIRGS